MLIPSAHPNTAASDLIATELNSTLSPDLPRNEVEREIALIPSITNIPDKSIAIEQSEQITLNHTENSSMIETTTKNLTCSNVASIIPDSLEITSSQQTIRDPEPGNMCSVGEPALSLSEVITHAESSPMTRNSNPVETWLSQQAGLTNYSEENSPSGTSLTSPTHTRSEPRRHPNTNHKVKDWSLEIIKPVVIVGDSNLSRIPSFEDDFIQIDSFPGAKLYHMYEILKKLQPNHQAREVVLLIGLNNCLERLLPKTVEKQLSLLASLAKQTFPKATIRFPVINFSTELQLEQQQRLKKFNDLIRSKCNFLTEINPSSFHVETRDQIHWTSTTAEEILNHWLSQLNCTGN